jgi:hypothetical protein
LEYKVNNDNYKLSGTLLVNCSGSACRNVIQQSEKIEAVTFVFRVEKKSQEDPDVIIDVSGSKEQIQQVESSIRKISGVRSVNHEIGSSLLY